MGKHSKNAGVMGAESLTYHERKALGFGTVSERLGKDSIGNYYDCRLTLRPAVDPVCTPDGFLFSREAILENLLAQKKANKRKLAAWKAQQAERQRKAEEKAAIEAEAAVLAFDRQNHAGASAGAAARLTASIAAEADALLADKRVASGAVNIRAHGERMAEMRAFWLPSKTPEAAASLEAPDGVTRCPASGKPLRLRDLTSVALTPLPDGAAQEFMDPVSRDPFTNATRLMVIKPTGDVVSEETWRTCILPEGSYRGVPLGPEDAIELQRGGTGFAEHDKQAQAKKFFHLGPGSGLSDRRGQHGGPVSKFGLRIAN
ncbi:hypothetical protein ACKKBF_B17225 [Auxenochlorella protothecoides x Auxenochlorella symbiontica]